MRAASTCLCEQTPHELFSSSSAILVDMVMPMGTATWCTSRTTTPPPALAEITCCNAPPAALRRGSSGNIGGFSDARDFEQTQVGGLLEQSAACITADMHYC